MSATLVALTGTTGIHGIAADETGLIISSLKDSSKKKTNDQKNRVGNRVGRADYDHSMEITMEGELTASSGWAQRVSGALVLTNAVSSGFLPSGIGTGQTLIDQVDRSREREGWHNISVSAELLPCFPSV